MCGGCRRKVSSLHRQYRNRFKGSGKGIVQQIMSPWDDGTAVKMTISACYAPNGNNIHGIGIESDVVCEFDGEAYYGSEDHPDNQLEKAKEVLRGDVENK